MAACASLTAAEEGLEVEPSDPWTREPGEARRVPGAEVQACAAASVPRSSQDVIRAD